MIPDDPLRTAGFAAFIFLFGIILWWFLKRRRQSRSELESFAPEGTRVSDLVGRGSLSPASDCSETYWKQAGWGEASVDKAEPESAQIEVLRSIDGNLKSIAAAIGNLAFVLERNAPTTRSRPKQSEVAGAPRTAQRPEAHRPAPATAPIGEQEVLDLANRLIDARGKVDGSDLYLTHFRVLVGTTDGFVFGGPVATSEASDLIGLPLGEAEAVAIPGLLFARRLRIKLHAFLSGDLDAAFTYKVGQNARLVECAYLVRDGQLWRVDQKGVIEGPPASGQ
jgi:hypothetical protein